MSDAVWAGVVSFAIGVIAVVVERLLDRYLPDTTGQHPLPPAPGAQVRTPPV